MGNPNICIKLTQNHFLELFHIFSEKSTTLRLLGRMVSATIARRIDVRHLMKKKLAFVLFRDVLWPLGGAVAEWSKALLVRENK